MQTKPKTLPVEEMTDDKLYDIIGRTPGRMSMDPKRIR